MFNNLELTQISPIYQSIRMFDTNQISSCRAEGLSFELFLPWIWKIMLSYQNKEDHERDDLLPQDTNFSKGYYSKKVN